MILYVPRLLNDAAHPTSSNAQVVALSALLNETVRQWVRFNERWPAVRGKRRMTTARQAAQILRYIHRVFRELQAQFESLIEAFTDACDRPNEHVGDAVQHPFFRHAREMPREVRFTAVAFPPHLKQVAFTNPEAASHIPINQVLGEFLQPNECELIDECFNALAEDLPYILDIAVRRHTEFTNAEEAFGELWLRADHAERHCDMAREAAETAHERLSSV